MNFDTFLDVIPLVMWLVGILFSTIPFVMNLKGMVVSEDEVYEIEEKPTIGLLERAQQKQKGLR
jgi:hypothetical protein